MKALRIARFGDPDVLEITDVPQPAPPAADQILVRVRAAGLNRADILQRRGKYPPPPGAPEDIPGLEFTGEIVATGPQVRSLEVGQRVFGLVAGGAQAEFVLTTEALAVVVPNNLSDVEAGGAPEIYITAHDALFAQARLAPGERVLIHAVGSGVGLAALQLAKATGCFVLGTSRSADKLRRAAALGLDVPIDPAAGPFDEALMRATGGAGADVIIDFIGADYLGMNLASLAQRGRLVFVSSLSGASAQLVIPTVMSKRATLVGTVLRGRPLDEKIAATRAFAKSVVPMLASGAIGVPVDRIFPLEEASAAHRWMEENRNFGKVVLTV